MYFLISSLFFYISSHTIQNHQKPLSSKCVAIARPPLTSKLFFSSCFKNQRGTHSYGNGSELCTNKEQESYSLQKLILLKTPYKILLLGVLLEEEKNINVKLLILNKINGCLKSKSETLLAGKRFLLPLKFIQPYLLIFFFCPLNNNLHARPF